MQIKEIEAATFVESPNKKVRYVLPQGAGTHEHTFPEVGNILILNKTPHYIPGYDQVAYVPEGRHYADTRDVFNMTLKSDFEFEPVEISKEDMGKIIRECIKNPNMQSLLTYKGYSIGSDPEVFVTDKGGNLLNAYEFLPKKPVTPKEREKFGLGTQPIYWDGFQAEFETQPNTCLAYLLDSTQRGLYNILQAAKKHKISAKLSLNTVMNIDKEVLAKAAEENVQFGCMPSFNAYGIEVARREGRDVDFRPVGGHMHFGVGKLDNPTIIRGIKALDAILGVACVSMFAKYDDPRRRLLYGLPGEFRLPPHGIEYRTLSNAWLSHPIVAHLVFDLGRKSLNLGIKNVFEHLGWTATEQRTIDTIRNCNVEEARKIMEENKDIYITLLKLCYHDTDRAMAAYSAFYRGMESIIVDPTDIETNWALDSDGNRKWITHCGLPDKQFSTAYKNIIAGKKVA